MMQYNPFNASELGADFYSDGDCPEIDFASIHLWMDDWRMDKSRDFRTDFIHEWIDSHLDVGSSLLNKPVVLTEFGTRARKVAVYREV